MDLSLYPWLEKPADTLRKMREKLPGGILIYGPRGSGTFELAVWFASLVVCTNPTNGEPCGVCKECLLAKAGTHPDLKFVLSETEAVMRPEPQTGKISPLPKGKSYSKQIVIEQVREISEFLSVTAFRSGRRAVVIYPADTMSEDQSSALLKTLEEPPEGTVLILTADDLNSILPTIRSRCQLVRVTPPNREQGIQYLKKQRVRNPEGELARLGGLPLLIHETSPGVLLDKKDEQLILSLLVKGPELTGAEVIGSIKSELAPGPVLAVMQRWYWDVNAVAMGLPARYFPELEARARELAKRLDVKRLYALAEVLNSATRTKDHPLSKKLTVQTLLIDYATILKNSLL